MSDWVKDLVKIVLKAGVAFNHWFASRILNKSTVWVEKNSMWRFMWRKREFWVSWKKCNPSRKPTPFSFASHAIHTCFNLLFFNLVYGVLQLFTNSYRHFFFAELERKLKGNVDCVNDTFTSFHTYRVSQKFVSPISCVKTIDQNLIFYEISRRYLLLYRVHVIRRSKFS